MLSMISPSRRINVDAHSPDSRVSYDELAHSYKEVSIFCESQYLCLVLTAFTNISQRVRSELSTHLCYNRSTPVTGLEAAAGYECEYP